MSYFVNTILLEINRMSALRDVYENQLTNLPKGSVQIKDRNGKIYYYLVYRNNGRVISEYAGNDEAVIAELKEQLERRKCISNLLKRINSELSLMNKAMETVRR